MGSFEAIHSRHGEIEEDQVGFGFLDALEGLEAGGGFAADVKSRLIFQQGANAAAHDGAESFETSDSHEYGEVRDLDGQRGNAGAMKNQPHHEHRVARLRVPRPFCVVALRAKVDPRRSVAALSNGLLAIRMGEAGLETPVPCVA
jgi:hypothetical protein